jgi:probable F420-dependent oxidoreductase
MRVDLWAPTASPIATPELLATLGREADERGFSCLWVGEHVVLFEEYASSYPYAEDGRIPAPPGSGLLEPLNTLSFLAAHTTNVRLGTAMVLLPQRNPVYTAKEVATLDWLSNGRVDLGVGVGWLEEEFRAVNVSWPQRGRRTDEYLEVLTTLWTDETSQYEGEFYSLDPCQMFPKPIQHPVPIHIGGESDAALRRVARAGHGWHTFNRAPEELSDPLAKLDGLLAEEGRSRADITVTVCPYFQPLDADIAERYAEAGADAVAALVIPMDADSVRSQLDGLVAVQDRAAALAGA